MTDINESQSGDLEAVRVFDQDWEAHLAQGALEEAGIPSVIDNAIMAATIPIGFNSIGGVRLMVFSRDAERARDVLNQGGFQ
ncbi:MAG: DUF2007 domain-containing protein [Muribaculaceae bacterium]|nr:DUF2007 domain-containing protein [Muribaculaceae bacterium]